jgi:two-component system response regulator HydG
MDTVAARNATYSLLVVDDEVSTRNLCRDVAADAGLQVYVAATTEEALDILDKYPVDIVVTDLQIPQIGGLELLKRTLANNSEIAVIVLTQYGTIATAIEATRLGAADYVTKPFHVQELRAKLDRLIHSIEMDQENRLMREELRSRPGFGGLIGMSPRMQRVYKLIQKVSQHKYPVLILGESGTGRELVARSIHFSGPRKNKSFAPVDCSSLVPTLIESELFGYVKGRFHRRATFEARIVRSRRRRHPSFSMKSAICPSTCRPSCCAPCRSVRSSRWARTSASAFARG